MMARDPYRKPGRVLDTPRSRPRALVRPTALVVVFAASLFGAHLAFVAGAPLRPCLLVITLVAAGVAALIPPEQSS